MAAPMSQAEVDAMMEEAFALLEAGEPEQAMTIGRRLETLRFSGGFEIQALAYQNMGENGEAIRVLEKGAKRVADVWLLWQLLGNCLSDEGRFDEALTAYDTAIDLPQSDRVSMQFNRATALWRGERLDEANAIIAQLLGDPVFAGSKPELKVQIHAARIGNLSDLGLHQGAIAYFDSLPDPEEWSEYPAETAWLETKYAIALWRAERGEDANKVLACAIQRDKTNAGAQWLKREMRQRGDPVDTNSYDLLIHGPWHADVFPEAGPAEGFFTRYQVMADDLDEALTFVREFEAPDIRDALEIEEVEAQERCAVPKGVYWTSDYNFYEED